MKSLLGLKAKASTMVKDKMDQVKSRPTSANAIYKPFEGPLAHGREEEGNVAAAAAPEARSRSSSPQRRAEIPISQEESHIDPVIEHLLQNARSDAVRKQFLSQPVEDYTAVHSLKLLTGTYNVNGRMPDSALDIKPWVDGAGVGADIVALAFQEIVPLSAQNVVIGARLDAATAWDGLVDAALNGPSEGEGVSLKPCPGKGLENTHRKGQGSSSSHPEGAVEQGICQSGRDAEAVLSDNEDLEGYLSPAEDTLSNLSDDSKPKAFAQVVGKQMVGVYLSIWVKRALLKQIRGVQVTTIGTGVMGYLGNKGAVAARMRVYDTGLNFIAAHLSSGQQEGDELKRNYDYSEIVRRGQFPADSTSVEPEHMAVGGLSDGKIAGLASASGQWGQLKGLLESSYVIWMGDLNYRIAMPDAQVRAAIKAGNLIEVEAHDELKNMMKEQRAFQHWHEGDLKFPPTFKYKLGTHRYLGDEDDEDTPDISALSVSSNPPSLARSSPNNQGGSKPEVEQKRRTPAWTDRILWRPDTGIKQLSYDMAHLTASDHMPVVASFTVMAKEYVRSRVEAAIDYARRSVDAKEMASMPRCELEPLAVDTGIVTYANEKVVHLILTNTGQVKAHWQFAHLPGGMFSDPQDQALRRCPRWARVSPEEGTLAPGEAIEIVLRIWVDGGENGSAMLLTSTAGGKLDAILVLRVEDGNDIFCSVNGVYLPSFFGLPLNLLAALPRPLSASGGWESGSPRLRINTLKKSKQEGGAEADVLTRDSFYSPPSSFHNSPLSGRSRIDSRSRDIALRRDVAIAREKAHRKQSSRSSLGSELEAFSPVRLDSGTLIDKASPSKSSGPASAQDASIPGYAEPSTGADLAAQISDRVASGAAAQSSQTPESPDKSTRSGSTAFLLPPELASLTAFLKEKDRLQTPGLFINSVDLAQAVSPRSPDSWQPREKSRAVSSIRAALDRGQTIAEHTQAQDVAATILAFFCALPSPFMPSQVSSVCQTTVPSRNEAASLLGEAMSPAEWAIFRHMTDLMRAMCTPHNAQKNGTTREALANLFSEVWFDRMPMGFKATSQDLRAENIADLQKLADSVSQVAERRSALIATFLS